MIPVFLNPNGDSASPVTLVTRNARIDLLFTMSDITRHSGKAEPARINILANETWKLAAPSGGARRDRTDDLLLAKQALSQLSYGPLRSQQTGISNQEVSGSRVSPMTDIRYLIPESGGPGKI